MSRVITVTQVHFQACKWFAICWLSYANVPCGVLTSWGGGNTMGARGRPAGLEQGKDTRVRFFFFKREELENFQRSRLSPVKTSSYFSSSSSSPPFLNFCWTVARRTLFFHPSPINSWEEAVSGCVSASNAGNCCFGCEFPEKNSSSTAPPPLSQARLHYAGALFDQWHCKCHEQSPNIMRSGDNYGRQALAVTNFASRSAGRRGRKSDYVIDIYLDRMKVL